MTPPKPVPIMVVAAPAPPGPCATSGAPFPSAPASSPACDGAEPFALQVLGTSMAPEFSDGDVIVVEPGGLAQDGSFVVAPVDSEWSLRQLAAVGAGWELRALDPAIAATPLADLDAIRGVVIQKSRPGRRRSVKRYVD